MDTTGKTAADVVWSWGGLAVMNDGTLCDAKDLTKEVGSDALAGHDTVGIILHMIPTLVRQGNAQQRLRLALPEYEQGLYWVEAALAAIDTRREVLAAVDAHVPGWDPARPVAEVVGHLADEIIAWKRLHAEEKVDGYRVMVERDELKASIAASEDKAETYRKQGEADWNACCDVLVWSRRFDDSLPPPSRAVAAVCDRVKELDPMFHGPNAPATGAPSPEFETARLAESVMRMRFVALAEGEEKVARLREKAATNTSDSNYWAGRVQQANALKNMARTLAVGTAEHVSPAYEFAPMESDPYVSMVTEFHHAMRLPVRTVPSVGTVEERVLRVRLLLEEVLEYAKASGVDVYGAEGVWLEHGSLSFKANGTPDIVAMTHELGDCQVIVSGCAVQLGLPLLAAVREEIHPANMRKLGPDGRPVVRADGKVVKPEGWKPANVARIVERALAAGEVANG